MSYGVELSARIISSKYEIADIEEELWLCTVDSLKIHVSDQDTVDCTCSHAISAYS